MTATLTVENAAAVDGTFVAGLNRVGPRVACAPAEPVLLDVSAGETVEWEYTCALDDPEVADLNDPFVRFHPPWPNGSPTRVVDITE